MLSKKDLDAIQKDLISYDQVRESVFAISRNAVRLSGASILAVHRGDLKSATSTLKEASETLSKLEDIAKGQVELLNSSSVRVAYQEFVEASTLYEFVENGKLPSLKETGANFWSYVLGLLDVIGEFRRMALNSLRKGEVERAEKLLDVMDGMYEDLQSLEHTSIVPTFRVKLDVARKVIESTRGDVVTEVRRYSLEQALDRVGKRLSSKRPSQD